MKPTRLKRLLCAGVFAVGFVVTPAHAGILEILKSLLSGEQGKVSATKVASAQVAMAAKAQINADVTLAQGEMYARGLLTSTVEQLETFRRFNGATGQGVQTCDAINQRNDVDTIARARDAVTFTQMPNGGRAALSPDSYEVHRVVARMDAYCSADEHNLGLCKSRFDGMASASTNYNKLITADQFTAKQLKAAQDFVAELVPPPLPQRRNGGCDAGCQSERMGALRVDAMASMVAVPMAAQLAGKIGQKTFAEQR
jgi:hypothetical protein